MGSAANFFTIVSQLQDEMEGKVFNKTQLLIKEILKSEKQALLDQIKILVDRESNNPLSAFQWQLKENILQFQCHSCNKNFSSNAHGTNPVKSYENSTLDDISDDDDPFLNEEEPPVCEDFKPRVDLSVPIFDSAQTIATEPEENHRPFENRTTLPANLNLESSMQALSMTAIGQGTFAPEVQEKSGESRDGGNEEPREDDGRVDGPMQDLEVPLDATTTLNEEEVVEKSLRYKCPYRHCALSFNKFVKLRSHVRKQHVGEHLYCAKCDAGFQETKIFVKHMKHHTNIMPVDCKYCKLKFVNEITHKRHLHRCKPVPDPNGARKCERCLLKFTNAKSLSLHNKHWCKTSCDQWCNKKFISIQKRDNHKTFLCINLPN